MTQATDGFIALHLYAECNSWEDAATVEYRFDKREQDLGATQYTAWQFLGTVNLPVPVPEIDHLDKSAMFVAGLTAQLVSERVKFAARVTELQALIQSHLALPDTTREVARHDLAPVKEEGGVAPSELNDDIPF